MIVPGERSRAMHSRFVSQLGISVDSSTHSPSTFAMGSLINGVTYLGGYCLAGAAFNVFMTRISHLGYCVGNREYHLPTFEQYPFVYYSLEEEPSVGPGAVTKPLRKT